jgi:hypothetical protein
MNRIRPEGFVPSYPGGGSTDRGAFLPLVNEGWDPHWGSPALSLTKGGLYEGYRGS